MENLDQSFISDYLAGDMSLEEQTRFEQRLQQEPELAAQLQTQAAYLKILHAQTRVEAKATLRTQFDRYQQARRGFGGYRWIAPAIAASLALLLLFWWAPWSQSPSAETLAMHYLEPFPLDAARGAPSSEQALQNSATRHYQAANYAAALPLFEQLQALHPEQGLYALLRSDCLSQLEQYEAAIPLLKPLAEAGLYQDAAQWRLALNALLAGQDSLARSWLAQIRSTSHYRKQQADSLLKQMDAL